MILFSVEQYIFPHLESVVSPMADRNVLRILEKVLKLSIPNTYTWLLVFYFYFHLWLNLLAELTRFGDRQFYKEWYAATAAAACSSSYLLLLCA
jgi:diacylglycerol O-acyltransferase-1